MIKRVFTLLLLPITCSLFCFCSNPNSKKNEPFTVNYEKIVEKEKQQEHKENLNKELCALITAKEFVFSEEVKKTIDSLLHIGADINCNCEITNSYISKAIGSGYYFRKFFNLAQKQSTQIIRSPLPHFAYYTKNKSLIDFIKQFNADFNSKNEEGETLLDEAIKQEDINAIKELLLLNCKLENIQSIKTNNTEVIDFVIEKGSNVNLIDYNYIIKKTNLLNEEKTLSAIKKYNPSLKNKKINLSDLFFWNEKIVLELLKHGVDVNSNYKEKSILAMSILNKNTQLSNYVLENGFDIKLDNNNEYPALFAAVETGDKKNIDKLIDMGSNIKQATSYGNVIHMCALNKKNGIELADFFYNKGVPIDYCAKNGTPLTNAVNTENIKFVQWLLDKKLSPNINCSNNTENPIFKAILAKNEPLIKLLIKNGLDLSVKNNLGETPYEYAITKVEFNMRSNPKDAWAMQYKRIAELVKPK